MTRYFNSFLITLVLYAGVIFAFFTLFADDKILIKKEKPLQKSISLKHIELMPIPKIEKKVEKVIEKKVEKKEEIIKEEPKKIEKKKIEKKKEIKKKVVKKVEKKKIVKKKPKKKIVKKKVVKKVEKKKIVEKKKKIEKKIEKKVIKKEPVSKPITEKTAVQKAKQQVVKEKIDVKQDYLAKHLSLIRKEIKSNVKYPKSAKRLNIQGIVRVKFTLHTNGKVDNIMILSGHARLKKATVNAVKNAASSFPRVGKTITIELPIEYKLN